MFSWLVPMQNICKNRLTTLNLPRWLCQWVTRELSDGLCWYLSSVFRIIEFGVDGGPAAKVVAPKYDTFVNHVTLHLGVKVPEVEVRTLFFLALFQFITAGPNLINIQENFTFCYYFQMKHVIAATIVLKGLGGLLFIFSSSFGAYLLVCNS